MLNVASYVMHRVDCVDQIDIRFISFNVLYYVYRLHRCTMVSPEV